MVRKTNIDREARPQAPGCGACALVACAMKAATSRSTPKGAAADRCASSPLGRLKKPHLRHYFLPVLCILYALCCAVLWPGCAPAPPPRLTDATAIDLTGRFSTDPQNAAAVGSSGSFERHSVVTRNGRREDAMTVVAPLEIRAGLAGLSGRFTLKFLAAPVFNIGDGVQMDVLMGGAGGRKQLFGRYFDAGRKAADRDWLPLDIPMDLSGAGDAYLEIRVSGGPQGDLIADWLALAEVRLVPAK